MSGLDEIWGEVTGEKETAEKEKKPEKVSKTSDETKKETEEIIPEKTPTEELSEPQVSSKPETPKSEEAVSEKPVEDSLWGESTVETTLPEKVEPPTVPSAPAPLTPPAPAVVETKEYDISPDRGTPKIVYTIYGLKGEGKTGLAFSFPGRIFCLSFDRKSIQIKNGMYKGDDRITVYDAIRYLEKSSGEMWLKTADKTLNYVEFLLKQEAPKIKPDWVVIDGTEIFTQLCEMVMRFRNGLQPFQGIANRNLWKERRMHIDRIHNACLAVANKGVIYTTYTAKDEIIKDGQFIAKKDVPKWIDAVAYFTDCVIRVRSKQTEEGAKFYASVESSKINRLPTGTVKEITNTGIKELLVGD